MSKYRQNLDPLWWLWMVVAMVVLCVPFGSHIRKYPAIGPPLSIKKLRGVGQFLH